jgi:carboxylesterase
MDLDEERVDEHRTAPPAAGDARRTRGAAGRTRVVIPAVLAGAAAIGALAAQGRRVSRRLEAALSARLPRGDDGIVLGAGPIDLAAGDARAALLVHGFGDTPQSLAAVALRLHADGWTVRAPLLPGHGRTLAEFAGSRADAWRDVVHDELARLRARHGAVALVGQSMGGALCVAALAEAARAEADAGTGAPITSLVLLAPYLGMPAGVRVLAPLARALAPLWPYHDGGAGARSIHDDDERAHSRGYGVLPGVLLGELARVVDRARAALPHVTVPTLVVQSRADHRIAPAIAEHAFARLGAAEKELVWLDACGHVIAADRERVRVATLVAAWVARASATATDAAPGDGAERAGRRDGAVASPPAHAAG